MRAGLFQNEFFTASQLAYHEGLREGLGNEAHAALTWRDLP